MEQKKYSNWVWADKDQITDTDNPVIVLFRRKVTLESAPGESRIRISADSRYKLYINDRLAEVGPSKGDSQIWFQDEIDIRSYLKSGDNVIAVEVLRFPVNPFGGNQSAMVTSFPGLYFYGKCTDIEGNIYDISADSQWRYRVDNRVEVKAEAPGFSPLHFYENVREDLTVAGWKGTGYDDSAWEKAVPYPDRGIRKAVSPGNLNARTIPFMYRKKRTFSRVMRVVSSAYPAEKWEAFLRGEEKITAASGTEEIVEIDAGEEMTGYLKLVVSGGAGSQIEILQSEAYVQNEDSTGNRGKTQSSHYKKDRLDMKNGHLEGYTDIYCPAGTDPEDACHVYEPFWFRTFRFIRLHITVGETPLVLHKFDYDETGYPLEIRSHAETSDASLADIWDISARTLKRCMHETYEDCPFYEQLQYVMDSRSQILYTYASAADDRLARKCMDDFRRSQRYDGMLCSAYPNTKPNVIPGFSIYYILMLHDHMMYFGDRELIRYHMPAVEKVLYCFEQHVTDKGYVSKLGDVHSKDKFWSFIDWAPQWVSGVPNAVRTGSITMESLLYLLGLTTASELAEFIGRKEQAQEYRTQAEHLKESIRKYCMGKNGMIKDGPECEEYSQHCQVFGVLTGVLDKEEGRKALLETLVHRDQYAQCTVSMALYLYRALEETELYEYTDGCWEIWREMVRNHMTTCAESDSYPRSECHAWGALALYELPSVILGVRPAAPGYAKVKIAPVPGYLTWAKGEAVTPKGMVAVAWKKDGDQFRVEYQLPEGLEASV